jgi:hypothetical protein
MVPYICLYKTVCDLSYRCIWYPIFVNIRQCVTCLIDVYGILSKHRYLHILSYIHWKLCTTGYVWRLNNHIKAPCLIRLCTKLPSKVIKKAFLYIISIFIIRSSKFDFGPVKLVFPQDRMSNESSDNFVKTVNTA